jgi:hypothetical protein
VTKAVVEAARESARPEVSSGGVALGGLRRKIARPLADLRGASPAGLSFSQVISLFHLESNALADQRDCLAYPPP